MKRHDVMQQAYEAIVIVRPPLPVEHVKAVLALHDLIRKTAA